MSLLILPYLGVILLKILHIGGGILCVDHLVTYYRYFLIGFLCRKYVAMHNLIFFNHAIFAIGFIMYLLQWRYCDMHNMVLIFLGAIGAIVVIQSLLMNLANCDNLILSKLAYIGRNSLYIYVIHYFFIPDLSSISMGLFNIENPFIWQLLLSSVISAPIIVASLFIGHLIESNKYLNAICFCKLNNK